MDASKMGLVMKIIILLFPSGKNGVGYQCSKTE